MTGLEPKKECQALDRQQSPPGGWEELVLSGLRKNTIYLLKGPPASGKTVFCFTVALELMKAGNKVICIKTDIPPEECQKHMAHGFNIDLGCPAIKGLFRLIDAYSWRLQKNSTVLNITDLGQATHILFEVLGGEKQNSFLILDSLSSFVLYNELNSVVKWVEVIIAKMREKGMPGIIVVEEGIHDDAIINMLSVFVDGILETKLVEVEGSLKRFFRVFGMRTGQHSTAWVPFEITSKDLFKLKPEESAEQAEAHGIFGKALTQGGG